MNTKTLIVIILVVIVLGFGLYFATSGGNDDSYTATTSDTTGSPFRAEENAIVITEQPVGATTAVASLVYLSTPGFVVIHEEDSGAPGTIIGSSDVLEIGENLNVQVVLMRPLRDGERLYAMLHADTDNDGSFDAAADMPIQSVLGGPIMGIFEVAEDAATGTPVTI